MGKGSLFLWIIALISNSIFFFEVPIYKVTPLLSKLMKNWHSRISITILKLTCSHWWLDIHFAESTTPWNRWEFDFRSKCVFDEQFRSTKSTNRPLKYKELLDLLFKVKKALLKSLIICRNLPYINLINQFCSKSK